MYVVSKVYDQCVSASEEGPYLRSTEEFWKVIETIPEREVISMSVIKLGLLTGQLDTLEERISVEVDTDNTPCYEATILASTLRSVRRLLLNLSPQLDETTKKEVGIVCEKTGLNRPPNDGCEIEEIRELSTVEDVGDYPGLNVEYEEYSGLDISTSELRKEDEDDSEDEDEDDGEDKDENEAKSNSREETIVDTDPTSSGKRVAYKGGERITGKNPHADTDRLKDTGLHQGGG